MPFIKILVLKGTLTKADRAEMISRVTEAVAEIECRPAPKEALLPYTHCVIEEVEFGNWGAGGNVVTPEMLKALKEG